MRSSVLAPVISSRIWRSVLAIGEFVNRITALRLRIIFGEPAGWRDLFKSPRIISAELAEVLGGRHA